MYRAFFGLGEAPFRITPDPRFLHIDPAVQAALDAVAAGVTERASLVLLVGEVGTGKTTLVRRLLDTFPPEVRTILVLYPTVGFEEILDYLLLELGLPVAGGDPDALLERLAEFLREHTRDGGTVAVFFDEAQALSSSTFAALERLLDLSGDDGRPALQVVLAGQPELEARLAAPELASLRARVGVTARLAPLSPETVAAYVRARLVHAQARDPDLFTPDALARLAAHSHGIPRVINVLCESALVAAFAEGQPHITGPLIEAVWADYAPLHEPQGTPMPAPPADSAPGPEPDDATGRFTVRRMALAAIAVLAVALVPLLATRPWHTAPPIDVTPPETIAEAPPPTEPVATATTMPEPEVEAIAPARVPAPSALDAIALVDRFWQAYGVRDTDTVRALFTPDAAPTGTILDVDPTGGNALVTPAPTLEAKPMGNHVTVRVPFQLNTKDDRGRPVRRQGVANLQVATYDGATRIVGLTAESGPVPRR